MTLRGTILLVDDEEKILKTLGRALRDDGHEVAASSSAEGARRLLSERDFDLLIVDYRMPDRSGLELMTDLAASTPDADRPQVVMMTAHASVETAIAAMKLGAFDYLQKPFEVEALLAVALKALEHQRLRRQHRYLLSERDDEFGHYGIVGTSPAMREVIRKLERVARTKSTVLVTGETGTGKELVARAIHAKSAERDMPLIKVNCAAIPEGLIESELFGHVRGAFTGATASKKGKFALADGGSLFLDEIGTLAPAVQAKLLRVLQEREFEPVGSDRTSRVDLRVIAATNRDLPTMVAEGRFLEDLFYRLSVIPIPIPPLRERCEDVADLAEHFVRKHAARVGKAGVSLSPGAMGALRAHDWPGNVRELENAIERAVVLSASPSLEPEDVQILGPRTAPRAALPSLDLRANLAWAERETLRLALERAGGVKKRAAELLGVSPRALSHYLSKLRLD